MIRHWTWFNEIAEQGYENNVEGNYEASTHLRIVLTENIDADNSSI